MTESSRNTDIENTLLQHFNFVFLNKEIVRLARSIWKFTIRYLRHKGRRVLAWQSWRVWTRPWLATAVQNRMNKHSLLKNSLTLFSSLSALRCKTLIFVVILFNRPTASCKDSNSGLVVPVFFNSSYKNTIQVPIHLTLIFLRLLAKCISEDVVQAWLRSLAVVCP